MRKVCPCQQRISPERSEYKSGFRLEKVSGVKELCGMRARYIRTVLQFKLYGPAFSLHLKVSVLYKGPNLAKVVYLSWHTFKITGKKIFNKNKAKHFIHVFIWPTCTAICWQLNEHSMLRMDQFVVFFVKWFLPLPYFKHTRAHTPNSSLWQVETLHAVLFGS